MVTPETQVAGTNPPREYAYLSPLSHASCAYLCKHLLICKTCPVLQTACRHQTAGGPSPNRNEGSLPGRVIEVAVDNSHSALGKGRKRISQMHWGSGFFSSYIHKAVFFFFFLPVAKLKGTLQSSLNFIPRMLRVTAAAKC